MNDLKTLFLIVLSMGSLAAIWWLGWFDPIVHYLLAVKRLTTH